MIANYDCAVAQIARTVVAGSYHTPSIFQLDPFWDPIRQRADFKKAMATRQVGDDFLSR